MHGTNVLIVPMMFGETNTGYWDANPGSRQFVPWISNFTPNLSTDYCPKKMLLAADGQDDLLTHPRPDLVPMIIHADPIAIVEAITASNMPSGGGTHTNTSLQIVEVLRGRAKGTIEARK